MAGLNNDRVNMKLCVLISSYGDRLLNFMEIIPDECESVKYIIGHQGYKSAHFKTQLDKLIKNRKDILYYSLDTIGVTKSRNFLIEKATSELIYFCDDDVELESNFADIIIRAHHSDLVSVITFKVNNEKGEGRKKFSKMENTRFTRGWFSILSVGTIEVTVKRDSIGNIRFPVDMGAGTKNPIGDEAVFLSSFLKKGEKISYHPTAICRHPEESSGCENTKAMAYSRGLTLRRVFSYGSFIIAPFFFLRRKQLFKVGGSYWKGFVAFLSGISGSDLV